jgi:hypothetical protein
MNRRDFFHAGSRTCCSFSPMNGGRHLPVTTAMQMLIRPCWTDLPEKASILKMQSPGAGLLPGSRQHHDRPVSPGNGVFINDVELKPSAPTLAETFAKAGYRTGYIGSGICMEVPMGNTAGAWRRFPGISAWASMEGL